MGYAFTKAVFGEVKESEINYDKHRPYIIGRVLNYGTSDRLEKAQKMYSKKTIISEAVKVKDLPHKTLNFLSAYFKHSPPQ